MFDLLLKGGVILDPVTGTETRADVGIWGGRVSAIEPAISDEGTANVIDVTDAIVVPGLVDAHSHVYRGVTVIGLEPDEVCFSSGVTTTADGGSCGADTFAGFRSYVVKGSRARVFCFVNLSRLGGTGNKAAGELVNPAYADPDGTLKILEQFPDVAVGVKLRTSSNIVGGSCMAMLKVAKQVTNDAGKPLMVHIGGTVESMTEVLPMLVAGDIVTHHQTPKANGLLDERGTLLPEAREARERGVIFDSGHGRTHFSFDVAERLLQQDFPPDTLSTDISKSSYADLAPGLLSVMNMWLAIGLPLPEVIRATTSRSAEILGKAGEFGQLTVGGEADVTVLSWQDGAFHYRDAVGGGRSASRRLAAELTIRAGELVWRRDGTS
jgi:dihydroorotase